MFFHFFLKYICSWDISILFKVDIQSLPCTSKSCEERKSYMEGTHAYLAHVASLVSCYYFFLPMDCVIFSRLSIYNPTPLTLDNVILTTLTILWSGQRIPDITSYRPRPCFCWPCDNWREKGDGQIMLESVNPIKTQINVKSKGKPQNMSEKI